MFSLIRVINIAAVTADSAEATSLASDGVRALVVVGFILLPLLLFAGFIIVSSFRYLETFDSILQRVFGFLTSLGYPFRLFEMRRLGYHTSFNGFTRIIQDTDDSCYKILVRESIEHWGSWRIELDFIHVDDFGSTGGYTIAICNIKTLSPYEAIIHYESEILPKDIETFCRVSGTRPLDSLTLISSRTPYLNDKIVKNDKTLEYERFSGSGVWYES